MRWSPAMGICPEPSERPDGWAQSRLSRWSPHPGDRRNITGWEVDTQVRHEACLPGRAPSCCKSLGH